MSSTQDAFYQLCQDATKIEERERRYVSLYREVQYYGGPEEGGWWGTDMVLESYYRCTHAEQAEQVAEQVQKLADQMTEDARRAHNEHAAAQVDYCESRGIDDIDAFYGREEDGPDAWHVITESYPGVNESYGPRHYE